MSLITELEQRFTDPSEIHDVSMYGMAAGFNGFIYSSELYEFFEKHEEEIEDILDSYQLSPIDLIDDPNYWTFQELREKAVWTIVELWCHSQDEL